MDFGFTVFKLFPHGGLGRDLLRIANALIERGHTVRVYAIDWLGDVPPGIEVVRLEARGITIRARIASFVAQLVPALESRPCDAIVGFNRMPGLDVYYAADVCHAAALRDRAFPLHRLTPRHRLYLRYEREVFDPRSSTEILVLAEQEMENYIRCYGTPRERFHLLPPGIDLERVRPDDADRRRELARASLRVSKDEMLLLLVGSNFALKGLDRALGAVAALPEPVRSRTMLGVVGKDAPARWQRRARRLGIGDRVRFLGLRDDVSDLLLAADLLIHPAVRENTGTVILEAIVAGLPVIATETCGYSPHIVRAEAGAVVSSRPFDQGELDRRVLELLQPERLVELQANALRYARSADLHGLVERAVDAIETVARRGR
ncbi:MAG TPA: glycosyltransferase family 4 protein [Planctomycetota bacterium]|nr:glycosyltransferase family 4 protein [Planctomycetota bacterium]